MFLKEPRSLYKFKIKAVFFSVNAVNVVILLFKFTIELTVNCLNLFSFRSCFFSAAASSLCIGVSLPYFDCKIVAINSEPVNAFVILNTENLIARSSRINDVNAELADKFFLDLTVYIFDARSTNDIIVSYF